MFLKIYVNFCNIAQHFCWNLKGLACQKKLTLSSVSLCRVKFFELEYLRKNKFLRKTILTCISGVQTGLCHEKNEVKSLVTLPDSAQC